MSKYRKLLRLWPYLKPFRGSIILALFLSIPLAAVSIGPVPIAKYLVDKILIEKDMNALRLFPIGVIALYSVNFVIRFLHYYVLRSAANRMIQKLRNDLYDQLLQLSLGYYSEVQGGVLVSRVINDVQIVVKTVSNITNLVRQPFVFLGLFATAIYLNWRLALLTVMIAPLFALLLGNTGKHAKRYSDSILRSLGEMGSLLSESISGMRVIHSFNLEQFMRGQFMKLNREFTRVSLKAIRAEELSHPAVELISGIAIAVLLYFGGKEVLSDRMSSGALLGFITSFGLMIQPLRSMNELNISFNQCISAVDSIFGILDRKPEVQSPARPQKMNSFSKDIEFRDVSFLYKNDSRPVLNKFNLRVKKGEVVALVGPSGAGKSTVLSMIPRFFDCSHGSIHIDGMDIRETSLESLRAQVSLVTQDVFLFHDSIRTNIRAGKHNVNDADIRAASEAAQAWAFIEKAPDGLDTVIGDRGQKLSGGERQRLSIARAILKDAPILLLDEATSALDSENERLVQAALDRLMVGRTAIVVAHRLSTIRKADRILVLEKGEIVEEGNHESLLARGGAYARALSLQEGFSS